MKTIIAIALALLAFTAALPLEKEVQIVKYENKQTVDGYDFEFETDDGIKRSEEGQLKLVDDEEKKPHNVIVVRGSYTYIGEDGEPKTITYIADEDGYRASGDSIPTAPAVVARR